MCEGSDRILPELPADLAENAEITLKRKSVEVRYNAFIEEYDGSTVRLRGNEEIPAATLIWTAGANTGIFSGCGNLETGQNKRLKVNEFLQLPGHREVYVPGDAAYWEEEGEALPMVAPAAVQMADNAALNIQNSLKDRPSVPFQYKSPGALATIGKNAAVGYIGGMKFKGFIAWMVWLVVHLIRLIGFRNRIFVLINWAWGYFFQERASRLILKIRKKIEPDERRS